MVNAWSLAYDVLNGTMDETYPIKKKTMSKDEIKLTGADQGVVNFPTDINLDQDSGDITIKTDIEHSDAWYDYNRNDPDRENPFTDAFDYMMAETVVGGGNTASAYPSSFNTFADNDDAMAHHVGLNYEELNLNIQAHSPYNSGYEQDFYKEELKKMTDSRNKYHENEILEDIKEYVSSTYNGHYTGNKHEFRNVQTIDLMASRDLASDFCQANILKYGSRYGSKDGRNKKDLLKVIHYAMLLLHFDEHYGKPSMTSGNIDHNMP